MMNRRTTWMLSAAIAAAATHSASAAEWEQQMRDAAASGVQPIAAAVTTLDTLVWENGTGYLPGGGNLSVMDGTPRKLFTWGTNEAGDEVYVHAFRTDSGEMLWSSPALDTGFSVLFGSTSSPSADVATNSVYFGTGQKVYRLNADTGAIVWDKTLNVGGSSDIVNASPHLGGGLLFIPTYAGFSPAEKRLYALDPTDGSVEWSVQDGGPGSEAPVYAHDGTIGRVFTLRDKGMAAYNAVDGTLLWSNAAPSDLSTPWTTTVSFFGGLGYSNGSLYATTYDFGGAASQLIRVEAATGQLEWSTSGVINGSSTPIVLGTNVIIAGESSFLNPSYLQAYNTATGALEWNKQKASSSTMWNVSAAATNDRIYVTEGSGGAGLHIVDPADGNDSTSSTPNAVKALGIPAIGGDGAIYVHHDGGTVACYRAVPFAAAPMPVVTLEDVNEDSAPGETNEATIRVLISGTSADDIRIGEVPYAGAWQAFTTNTMFTLSTSARRAAELRTVYVQIRVGLQESPPVAQTILFNNNSSVHDWQTIN